MYVRSILAYKHVEGKILEAIPKNIVIAETCLQSNHFKT